MSVDNKALSPDRQELRKFGFVFAAGLVIIFGLFFPWLAERPWPGWPFIAAAVFFAAGLGIPQALMPLYKLWMKVGHVLGWVNTRIILGVVFFAIFTVKLEHTGSPARSWNVNEWRNLSNAGTDKRFMGLSQGPQEILVGADYYGAPVIRGIDCFV